jgi:hypothetical protein
VGKNKKANDEPSLGPQRPPILTQKTFIYGMSGCFGLCRTAIRVVGWVAAVAILWLCVRELAGKETTVRAGLEGILKASIDRYIAWVVIAILAFFIRRQRKLNETIVKDRAPYISELEKRIDPGRSSSRLDEKGQPRKEDQDA